MFSDWVLHFFIFTIVDGFAAAGIKADILSPAALLIGIYGFLSRLPGGNRRLLRCGIREMILISL
jgi:hypothetical protein